MQGNGYQQIFCFDKQPTENTAQQQNGDKSEALETRQKNTVMNPYRKMDHQKQYRIDANGKPLFGFRVSIF